MPFWRFIDTCSSDKKRGCARVGACLTEPMFLIAAIQSPHLFQGVQKVVIVATSLQALQVHLKRAPYCTNQSLRKALAREYLKLPCLLPPGMGRDKALQ